MVRESHPHHSDKRLLLDDDDFGSHLAQLLHDAADVVVADVLNNIIGTG
jgi:hypothetical protein